MKSFYERLDKEENTLFDGRVIKIRPMYYSMDKIKWNFDEKIQNKIRNEEFNTKSFIPFTFYDDKKKIDACLYFPCICDNIKNQNCHSSNCKFQFSKNSNYNESMLKDGLEIMDIPSTYLINIERKLKIHDYDIINNYLNENRKIHD